MQSTTQRKAVNSNRTRFTIHVFPHLKKFIAKTYGAGVIRTEESTVLGRLVTATLREKRISKFSAIDWPHHLKPSESLTIQLTVEQARLSPRLNKLDRINLDMDKVFKESLAGWILAQTEAGRMAYTACKSFLEFYGIDDNEYSLDAAYKYYQRSKRN